MNNIHQQRGIVLIGMMIIVTLAWKQQHENFKLSKYTQTQQQALNYVYAMESWAKVILLNDKNTKVDTLLMRTEQQKYRPSPYLVAQYTEKSPICKQPLVLTILLILITLITSLLIMLFIRV